MAVADIKNFRVIDERLASAGQPTEQQLAEVGAHGYSAVINLGLLDPRYCLPDEAALCSTLGLRYRHIPVAFEAPLVADFEAFLRAMDELSPDRVFVHCAANYRASSFLSLYAELRLGWSRERADELARSLWQPNPVWLGFLATCRGRWLDSAPPSSARLRTGSAG
jgi:protein tyrosine phosphatase (PTP) superfamily phosphohydrolase (DUF442 family)